jgi:hypothetical protein
VAILGAYTVVSVAYTLRLPLVMDEFQGARAIYDVGRSTPYRDFIPYKTVLGYYLQWPFLSIPGDLWTRMLRVKIAMAGLTALSLGFVAFRLRAWLDDVPILAALAMLVSQSTFLERSAELRVDMLTALAGLLGFSALLTGSAVAAGVLTALSFLISQKGAYFVVAAGAAVLAGGAVPGGGSRWRESLRFWIAAGITLEVYLVGWSVAAGADPVLRTTFLGPRKVALSTIYDIHARFWLQTLQRNPGFYLWSAVALVLVFRHIRNGAEGWRFRRVAAYSLALTVLVIMHRQPWPYFFVLWLPTLWVVGAVGIHLARRRLPRSQGSLLIAMLLVTAGVIPLARIPVALGRDATLQRRTVLLARQMLGPDDRYLAAIEMVWDRQQSTPDLAWLDAPALAKLQAASPAELEKARYAIRTAPTKLILLNYRLLALPNPLRAYLESNYAHWSDCVFVFAPRFRPGRFALSIGGDYRLDTPDPVVLDGQVMSAGEIRPLARGWHRAETPHPFRLRLVPAKAPPPAPARPCGDLFPDVYGY